jgi:hypothetical protein
MDPKSFVNMAHKKVGAILMQDSGLMDILRGYHVVRLDEYEDDFNQKLKWCLEHCSGKFRDIRESEQRAWYFQHEQDATLFAMKWS